MARWPVCLLVAIVYSTSLPSLEVSLGLLETEKRGTRTEYSSLSPLPPTTTNHHTNSSATQQLQSNPKLGLIQTPCHLPVGCTLREYGRLLRYSACQPAGEINSDHRSINQTLFNTVHIVEDVQWTLSSTGHQEFEPLAESNVSFADSVSSPMLLQYCQALRSTCKPSPVIHTDQASPLSKSLPHHITHDHWIFYVC